MSRNRNNTLHPDSDFTSWFIRKFGDKYGRGVTPFQIVIIVSVPVITAGIASVFSLVFVQASTIASVPLVVSMLLTGTFLGFRLSRLVDHLNRDMKKTQVQFAVDALQAKFRKGHYVNGRRTPDKPHKSRVILSVGARYPRKG